MGKQKGDSELSKVASFRLTEADYAAYRKKFESSGLTQSEFFRQCVLTNRTQVIAVSRASPEKQRLLYLFNKSGNNLNQLAHRANADHLEGKLSETTYLAILDQLDAIAVSMKTDIDHVD
jgi:hypothetical protein